MALFRKDDHERKNGNGKDGGDVALRLKDKGLVSKIRLADARAAEFYSDVDAHIDRLRRIRARIKKRKLRCRVERLPTPAES